MRMYQADVNVPNPETGWPISKILAVGALSYQDAKKDLETLLNAAYGDDWEYLNHPRAI